MKEALRTPTRQKEEFNCNSGSGKLTRNFSPTAASPDATSPYLLSQNTFNPEIVWDGTSPNIVRAMKTKRPLEKYDVKNNSLSSVVSQLEKGIKKFSNNENNGCLQTDSNFEVDLRILPVTKSRMTRSKTKNSDNSGNVAKHLIRHLSSELENLATRLKNPETTSSPQKSDTISNLDDFGDDDIFTESFIESTQELEKAVWDAESIDKEPSKPCSQLSNDTNFVPKSLIAANKPKRKTFQLIASPKRISFQSNTFNDIAKCCAELDTSDDLFDDIDTVQFCDKTINNGESQFIKKDQPAIPNQDNFRTRSGLSQAKPCCSKLRFVNNIPAKVEDFNKELSFSEEDTSFIENILLSVTKVEESIPCASRKENIAMSSCSGQLDAVDLSDNDDVLLASHLDEVESQLPLSQSRCSREEIARKRNAALSRRVKKIKSCDSF